MTFQALNDYFNTLRNSNNREIERLVQRRKEITTEIRNLLKANDILTKTIQRIRILTTPDC